MREVTLQAEVRAERGKNTRALKQAGVVPGIFYVPGEENIALSLPLKSLKQLIYSSETHIVNLTLNNGMVKRCIVRDIQFDPVTEAPIHIDFQGLRDDRKITVEIPVVVLGGTAQGVKDGGVLQIFIRRVKVSCLPKDIPDHIEVNAEQLKINQFVHIRDLKIENVTFVENETSAVVGVIPPTIEKEPVAGTVAVEEAVEPEVIGKGKKLEEGEEGEAEGEKGEKKAEPAAKTATAAKAAPAPEAKEEKKKKGE